MQRHSTSGGRGRRGTKERKRICFEAIGGKRLPVGRDKDGTMAMWDQHDVLTVDIKLAWSAMVLLPTEEWATIKCYEGQIREHTLH